MDEKTSVQELKARVFAFCEARDWDQFHGPKDLAIGIITEASELLEEFRFQDEAASASLLAAPDKRQLIEEELADVLFFVLRFAQRFHVDLSSALGRKLLKNEEKYPVEKARGRNLKYTEL